VALLNSFNVLIVLLLILLASNKLLLLLLVPSIPFLPVKLEIHHMRGHLLHHLLQLLLLNLHLLHLLQLLELLELLLAGGDTIYNLVTCVVEVLHFFINIVFLTYLSSEMVPQVISAVASHRLCLSVLCSLLLDILSLFNLGPAVFAIS